MELPRPKCPSVLLWSNLVLFLFLAVRSQGASEDINWDAQFGVPGTDRIVAAVTRWGRNLAIGGAFTLVSGVEANLVARWDGTNWCPLGTGVGGTVLALATDGANLYAGGSFSSAGGQPVSRLARWDGTNWWPVGGGVNGIVHALATDKGDLYVGGSFTMAGAVAVTNIARWDGANWSPLGPGIGPEVVYCLLVSGGTLYAGGVFRQVGGINATNIAKWDGTNWTALRQGLRVLEAGGLENGIVRALASQGNDVFAAGVFRRAGDTGATNIARWDGTNWFPLKVGMNVSSDVQALVCAGGLLYAGGHFATAGGVPAGSIAQWDGFGWSPLGSGIVGDVGALSATGDELFVSGVFGTVGGKPSVNIALWHIPHALEIRRSGGCLELSWPSTGTNFVLESTGSLGGGQWVVVPESPVLVGERLVVERALDLECLAGYFRLRRR